MSAHNLDLGAGLSWELAAFEKEREIDAECGCLQDQPCPKHKRQLIAGEIDHFPPDRGQEQDY